MKTTKAEVRSTLKRASMFMPKLKNDSKVATIWFNRAEKHAMSNKHDLALWCLCVASYILFEKEMKVRWERDDIVSQVAHQFHAYGRKSEREKRPPHRKNYCRNR